MSGKSYVLSDLQVGMSVTTYQLSGIYNVYILLSQTHLNEDGSTTGVIEFIGPKQTDEMKKVFDRCIAKYGKRPMIYAHTKLDDGVYSI